MWGRVIPPDPVRRSHGAACIGAGFEKRRMRPDELSRIAMPEGEWVLMRPEHPRSTQLELPSQR